MLKFNDQCSLDCLFVCLFVSLLTYLDILKHFKRSVRYQGNCFVCHGFLSISAFPRKFALSFLNCRTVSRISRTKYTYFYGFLRKSSTPQMRKEHHFLFMHLPCITIDNKPPPSLNQKHYLLFITNAYLF